MLYKQYCVELSKYQIKYHENYISKDINKISKKDVDKICNVINELSESLVNTHNWIKSSSEKNIYKCSSCGSIAPVFRNKKEFREYITCKEVILRNVLE
jgi:hypothetical protein